MRRRQRNRARSSASSSTPCGAEHDLFDLGPGGGGPLAHHRADHRALAPAVDVEAFAQALAFDDGACSASWAARSVRGRKIIPDRLAPSRGVWPISRTCWRKKAWGRPDQDAGAVAGLAVGRHRAAVPDRLQRAMASSTTSRRGMAVDGADEADATGVVLRRRVVGVRRDQALAIVQIPANVLAHAAASRPSAASARALIQRSMSTAARCPSRTAQTTSEAPRTASPAANTPGRLVALVGACSRTVPCALSARSRRAYEARIVLRVEAQGLDHHLGGQVQLGVRRLDRAAAARVGRAELHARQAHAVHRMRVAEQSLRRRQPLEAHALLLRHGHFAGRARHVLAIAAIERRQPSGRPGARRCAHSPWRYRRRPAPPRRVPPHSGDRTRSRERHRRSPCGSTRSDSRAPETDRGSRNPVRSTCAPYRRRWRSAPRREFLRSSSNDASRPTSKSIANLTPPSARRRARRSTTAFSSLNPGMP